MAVKLEPFALTAEPSLGGAFLDRLSFLLHFLTPLWVLKLLAGVTLLELQLVLLFLLQLLLVPLQPFLSYASCVSCVFCPSCVSYPSFSSSSFLQFPGQRS